MTFFDDLPVWPGAGQSLSWSDVRRRCCQKRYLGPFTALGLAPFVVVMLMVFYDVPFQARYVLPMISRDAANGRPGIVEDGLAVMRTELQVSMAPVSPHNGGAENNAAGATQEKENSKETEDRRKEEEQKQTNEQVEKDAEQKRKEEEEKKVADEQAQRKADEDKAAAAAKEAKAGEDEEKKKEEERKRKEDESRKEEEEKKRKEEEKAKEDEEKRKEEEKAKEDEKKRKEEEAKKEEEEKKQKDEEKRKEEEKTKEEERKRKEEETRKEEEEKKRKDEERKKDEEGGKQVEVQTQGTLSPGKCDLFEGNWEYDPAEPLYTNETCFYVQGDQDCIKNGRPDKGYLHWRWKPRDCDLPRFDARSFLEKFFGKTIGFVGDSLARNQMQSLLCMLAQVEVPKKIFDKNRHTTWRYELHHVTLMMMWSPYLLNFTEEPLPEYPNVHGVLHLDKLEQVWASKIPELDIVVPSIGQWYFKPVIYLREDKVVGCHACHGYNLTEMGFYDIYRTGLRLVLDELAAKLKGIVILSTFAIQHFEHGPWSEGGECRRTKPLVESELPIFKGMHDEMHKVVLGEFNRVALDESRMREDFHLDFLDVTKISLLRADGHPGPYRRPFPFANNNGSVWVQNDCLHWCLPGPVDTWNQLLVQIARKYLV